MAQFAQPTQVYSAQNLAGMSPAEREAYFGSLSPEARSGAEADYMAFADEARRHFMALAVNKYAPCPVVGGGFTTPYSSGGALTFDFPTAGGAYAQALLVIAKLTVNCAVGTGAAYAINQGAPLTLFDNIQINLNGTQHALRPYMLKYLAQLRGYVRPPEPAQVLAGQKSTRVEANLNNGGTYPVATGNNTWNFYFRLPFHALSDASAVGLIPMQANGTKAQVVLTCAPSQLGNDPILHAIRTTAGTGAAVTVSGTIQIDAEYKDGTNMWQSQALALDLNGLPTTQYIRDQVLGNLVAASINRGRLTTLLQHYLVLLTIVDATTAGQFVSNWDNVQYFDLAMDSVGQNTFFKFGTGTNVSIYDYLERFRRDFGQDLDDGILPIVVGWGRNVVDSDNRDGVQALNMMQGGWPDVNYGIQLGSVGGASGVNQRIEVHLVSLNPQGLKLTQL